MEGVRDYEVVVVGSGFGGAIAACRAAKRWPGRVLVLERGKRYGMGGFPRAPRDIAQSFWNVESEDRNRPRHLRKRISRGLFDVRNYDGIDAVVAAGLGGGSLIYANVFLEPPDALFETGWPDGLDKRVLAPYYAVAREVLGARPVPQDGDPRRAIGRTALFQEIAARGGRPSRLADVNVFFGNDPRNPAPMGLQETNRYGAVQTSCVYCGECDVGCNTRSKNTLDVNYLFVAETRYGAAILTEHLAERLVPLDAAGNDDPAADGAHGWRVTCEDLVSRRKKMVTAHRVVVSAGTLGTNELLLRSREVFRTLPRLPAALGQRFSGNGDFLSFVVDADKATDTSNGPVITTVTDYGLLDACDRTRGFVLEDAAVPAWASWYVEGARPLFSLLPTLWRSAVHVVRRLLRGDSLGRVGFLMSELLSRPLSERMHVLLCMGLDQGNGSLTLDGNGVLAVDWPRRDSKPLYDAILAAADGFRAQVGGFVTPMPNYWWPFRNNITVHPLGGCALGAVTSVAPDSFGQVNGYRGLYVADGSLLPTAVGANPVATICALSEMVAHGITGQAPDAAL